MQCFQSLYFTSRFGCWVGLLVLFIDCHACIEKVGLYIEQL